MLLIVNQLVTHDCRQARRLTIHLRADEQTMIRRRTAGIEAADDEVDVGEDRGWIELLQSPKRRPNLPLGAVDVEVRRARRIVARAMAIHVRREILGAQNPARNEIAE